MHERRSNRDARLIETSLHARGFHFGTDGTAQALYDFVRGHFAKIPPQEVRRGDVLFFDLGGGCGDHAGLVETASRDGRIGFREWRGGYTRHSWATPSAPGTRRDIRGRILNTFLRAKHRADPSDTRYFAGDMFCSAYPSEAR